MTRFTSGSRGAYSELVERKYLELQKKTFKKKKKSSKTKKRKTLSWKRGEKKKKERQLSPAMDKKTLTESAENQRNLSIISTCFFINLYEENNSYFLFKHLRIYSCDACYKIKAVFYSYCKAQRHFKFPTYPSPVFYFGQRPRSSFYVFGQTKKRNCGTKKTHCEARIPNHDVMNRLGLTWA